MKPIDPNFIGSWTYIDEDAEEDEDYASAIFTFSTSGKGFDVSAIDPSDGEIAIISNVEWDGERLSFHSIFPSTDWPTKKVFTLLPDGYAAVENTTWETWAKFPGFASRKVPDDAPKALIPTGVDSPPFDPEFVGDWLLEEAVKECISAAALSITAGKDGYEVVGFDSFKGKPFELKELTWDGTTLSLDLYDQSGQFLAKNALTLLNDGRADLQLTQRDVWFKLERDFHRDRFLRI